jgi:uncharacterized protein YutE (UPF0331/DUF86 family)
VTNAALVARKLAVLEEHLRRLVARRPESVDAFRADTLLQDAVSMSLLVVVQEAVDIALHIASDEGWGVAARYADAFTTLADHGVIEPALAHALGSAVRLRNRVAHGYATLDVDRLWAELPEGERAFSAYSAAVARFLVASGG